jgi:hypothetical protein
MSYVRCTIYDPCYGWPLIKGWEDFGKFAHGVCAVALPSLRRGRGRPWLDSIFL